MAMSNLFNNIIFFKTTSSSSTLLLSVYGTGLAR